VALVERVEQMDLPPSARRAPHAVLPSTAIAHIGPACSGRGGGSFRDPRRDDPVQFVGIDGLQDPSERRLARRPPDPAQPIPSRIRTEIGRS
jgi:hypothetical protein